ncbi:MAG: DUF2145 domain-containing protein [Ideonella sp.]|nr:DUF2145 domain-containing protein [Ideonella sp.]
MDRLAAAMLLCAGLTLSGVAHGAALQLCESPQQPDATQQDKALRLAAIVKAELAASAGGVALISRSGVDLSRFGFRHSHAGFALKASRNAPWSVRQLYYACDEARPRIFDQGLAGFLLGSDGAGPAYAAVVLLPEGAAVPLARAALDDRLALQLLAPAYSANAYPFGERYQNCNQWVAEMLAASWGGAGATRGEAQQWLRERGYAASVFDGAEQPLLWLGSAFVPLIHADDHPAHDRMQMRYRVSMPASLEAFVRAQVPAAERVEFCRTERHVVVRRGWDPIADGCTAREGDRLIALD